MEIKEGDVVMCTVKNIQGTNIFLQIEGNGEGNLVMSEVAAGRIRNLREYVSPNKKIVCKVLKVQEGNIQLSLRRVTGKEREEVLEEFKKEKHFLGMLKTIIKEPENIIEKIKEKYQLTDFLEQIKENSKLLAQFFSREESQKLEKILSEKKEKEKEVRKTISLSSIAESGINDIKYILDVQNVDIKYLGSAQFLISALGKDFKEANSKIFSALEKMEKKAKEKKATLEIKEK